ncbi:hypothetical protein AMECASPLE_018241 [Ameca splendens]|uniref:Uncharacterized protein n=1 Tax=Ameca splendens TaxID=208324 RepID=A0ABV0ZZE9_9TELE
MCSETNFTSGIFDHCFTVTKQIWCQLCGSLTSVNLPQGSCGYSVAYHCQCLNACMNGWMTDCNVRTLESLDLIKHYKSAGHLAFIPMLIKRVGETIHLHFTHPHP